MNVVDLKPECPNSPVVSLELNERIVQNLLVNYFNPYSNFIVPNCMFGGGEMDLMVVSKAGYISEIEIKVSLSDWNADRLKTKWTSESRDKIGKFWYAVPVELIDKTPQWVTPETGLIAVHQNKYGPFLKTVRTARKTCQYKISEKELKHLNALFYGRYWPLWQLRTSTLIEQAVSSYRRQNKKLRNRVEVLEVCNKRLMTQNSELETLHLSAQTHEA